MSKIKFKNTGRLAKEVIASERYIERSRKSEKPIGISLPLAKKSKSKESLFKMTYTIEDQVKVNLKNLIMTRKGEYLCKPDFGTNLIDLYNSPEIENIEDIAMDDIQEAVSIYFPFVTLNNFTSFRVEETLENTGYFEVKLDYTINFINKPSQLVLKLNTSR